MIVPEPKTEKGGLHEPAAVTAWVLLGGGGLSGRRICCITSCR